MSSSDEEEEAVQQNQSKEHADLQDPMRDYLKKRKSKKSKHKKSKKSKDYRGDK